MRLSAPGCGWLRERTLSHIHDAVRPLRECVAPVVCIFVLVVHAFKTLHRVIEEEFPDMGLNSQPTQMRAGSSTDVMNGVVLNANFKMLESQIQRTGADVGEALLRADSPNGEDVVAPSSKNLSLS